MSLISIITLLVSIMLLIALFLHKKNLNEDYNYYRLTGEHLYDPQGLEEREKILFWVAVCHLVLVLFNSLYLSFK